MDRTVSLVLVDGTGAVLGVLPPYPVPVPHRQEVACVVEGARCRYGVDVVVLRLLRTDGPHATYLASVREAPLPAPVAPAGVDLAGLLAPHPLRAPYAELGGPAKGLAWAAGVLGEFRATQVKTWNLSSVWRLAHTGSTAWLKEVPAFFRHEGAVLSWLDRYLPGVAPPVIAADAPRVLLADVPGGDRYGAPCQERLRMLAALHRVQLAAAEDLPALRSLGVPDDGAQRLAARTRAVALRYGYPDLVDGVPERIAEAFNCGLPMTLVHGDFHPGNVTGTAILDWGDSVLGHPGFDLLRMAGGLPAFERDALATEWCRWWRAARPGCEPERALHALEPLEALRHAAVYAGFLDRIEPSEHVYHRDDPLYWLRHARAARVAP